MPWTAGFSRIGSSLYGSESKPWCWPVRIESRGINQVGIALWECSKPWLGVGFLFKGNVLLARSYCGLCCPIQGRTLIEYLGVIGCSLIDRRTCSSRQLLRMLRENRSSFCISSKWVVPVKYLRQKDSVTKIPIVDWASGKLVSTYFRVSGIDLYSLRDFL